MSAKISSVDLKLEEDLIRLSRYVKEQVDLNLSDERRTYPADFLLRLHNWGFLALLIPSEFGGRGLTHREFAHVARRMGQMDFTVASLIGNHNTIGVLPIVHSSVLANRAEVLQNIASNGAIASFAITEAGAGSNPRMMLSSVQQQKDGSFLLTGEKLWIGNSPLADYMCVFAKEYDMEGAECGVSGFLLERDQHPFVVQGEQLTMGLKAMPQARVTFDHISLTEESRLTERGKGLELAFRVMEYARFAIAASGLGVSEAAESLTRTFAADRRVWTGLLADNGHFQSSLGEIKLKTAALDGLVRACAAELDKANILPLHLSLTAKILAGEWVFASIDTCLQFLGGRGYTETCHVSRLFRDARVMRIFEGPTEALMYQLGAIVLRDPGSLQTVASEINADFPMHLRRAFVELINSTRMQELAGSSDREMAAVMIGHISAVALCLCTARFAALPSNVQDFLAGECADQIESFWATFARKCKSRQHYCTQEVSLGSSSYPKHAGYDHWPQQITNNVESKDEQTKQIITDDLVIAAANEMAPSTATHESVARQIVAWLRTHSRATVIERSHSLSELGIDSLLAYELLCFVEETFQIEVDESWILERPSTDVLAHRIVARLAPTGQVNAAYAL